MTASTDHPHEPNSNPSPPPPVEIGPRLFAVDLMERGRPRRSAGFVVLAPQPAIIETGGSRSVPHLLTALRSLEVPRESVAWIAVTHVHLDHAGGAGALLAELPAATVLVHPRGARHLISPERLVAGSDQVYGPGRADAFFGPVTPAPAERVRAMDDGAAVDLGGGRLLVFHDTPGHAAHHHAIYETGSGLLFGGDALGAWYPGIQERHGAVLLLPSTAPNQFDPEAMATSARHLAARLPAAAVAPTHGGLLPMDPARAVELIASEAPRFAALGEGISTSGEAWPQVRDRLRERIDARMRSEDIALGAADWDDLGLDLEICARGIVDLQRRRTGT